MMRPHRRVVPLHLLTGGQGDVSAAGHHPRHNAHAAGEHHGALGGSLPQRTGELAIRQGQHEGHGDDVGGMRMVDHAAGTIGGSHADRVVHEVAGELAGGTAAVDQAPHNAVAVALVVDLHHADAVLGIKDHIAEVLAAAGGQEVLARQVRAGDAHVDPGPGRLVKEGLHLRHFLGGQAVGQVAAVALMPALEPAVVAHADIALHNGNVSHGHGDQSPLQCLFLSAYARLSCTSFSY